MKSDMSIESHLITSFQAKSSFDQKKLVSSYDPSDVVKNRLADLKRDYGRADLVRNGTY